MYEQGCTYCAFVYLRALVTFFHPPSTTLPAIYHTRVVSVFDSLLSSSSSSYSPRRPSTLLLFRTVSKCKFNKEITITRPTSENAYASKIPHSRYPTLLLNNITNNTATPSTLVV